MAHQLSSECLSEEVLYGNKPTSMPMQSPTNVKFKEMKET
jgi:hypothetical protein